jgi:lipopolysaccharide/colanic/teichoic acid biosynthesis glycosyltransferase
MTARTSQGLGVRGLAGDDDSRMELHNIQTVDGPQSLTYLPSTVRSGLGLHVGTPEVEALDGRAMYRYGKRVIDMTLAVAMLPVIAAVGLVIAVLLKLNSRGPLFYRHRRIGYQGRTFDMWKFRTMRVDGDHVLTEYFDQHPEALLEWKRSHKLRNDPRVTVLGQFLRMTSLDELPQIMNVLSGEMTFVGPRPIVSAEVEKYGRRFAFYCAAKPGITGLWQVSGRNEVDYEQRTAYDEQYVAEWSPMLDARIFVKTFWTVWQRHGAY